jgi:hypothetical protein
MKLPQANERDGGQWSAALFHVCERRPLQAQQKVKMTADTTVLDLLTSLLYYSGYTTNHC